MRTLACLAVLVVTSTAEASPRGTIGGGVMLGGDQFVNAGFTAEATLHPGPLGLHAQGVLGTARDIAGHGALTRFLGGIETRCASIGFCVFAGLDVGYQHQTWVDAEDEERIERHHGLLVGPRVGFDTGGEQLRFRAALELLRYRRQLEDETTWQGSTGVTLSLARRF